MSGKTLDPFKYLQFFGDNRLPFFSSIGMSECGLTCLAMIAVYHGHKVDLSALRSRYPISIKGANVDTLAKISRDLNLQAQMYSLEMEGLQVLKTPAILHWNMNHFVVLKKITRKYAVIHDPSGGVKRLSLKSVAKSFTGVAVEFEPDHEFKPIKERRNILRLRDFWRQVKGIKIYLLQLLLLSGLLQGFSLVSPFYIQNVVDKAIGESNVSLLIALAIGFSLLTLFKALVSLFRSFVAQCMGVIFNFQLNNNLLSHLLKLPLSFFEKRHIGDIDSRFSSLSSIQGFLSGNIISIFLDGLMVVSTLVMLVSYSPSLTVIVCSVALVDFFIRILAFEKIRDITEEKINADSRKNSNFMETIRAITGIKVFGRESHRQQLWRNLSADQYNLDIRLWKWNLSLESIREIISGLENTVVVALAALMVIDGNFSVGMLMAFIAYKGQFLGSIHGLFDKVNEFRMLGLHLERISEIALEQPEVQKIENIISIDPDSVRGEITFKNINFRYGLGEPWILSNFSLHLNEGQSVALVGPSGCGKTTMMKIAIGLLEHEGGEILLDGINISRIGPNQYRRCIGAVMQNDTLLTGTLAENVCFFDPEPDQERIEECCRLASIHDDILNMPMRYNTLIGDMGSSLSGGQKQRILLARALYPNPKILFLDEATSHLDEENERIASDAIRKLKITRLIIAHRKETISTADSVVFFNDLSGEVGWP